MGTYFDKLWVAGSARLAGSSSSEQSCTNQACRCFSCQNFHHDTAATHRHRNLQKKDARSITTTSRVTYSQSSIVYWHKLVHEDDRLSLIRWKV